MAKKILVLLCNILFFQIISAQTSFVSVKEHQFILNNKPYYYIGANYWYGGFLGLEKNKNKGIERLCKELDFLVSKGVSNLRVLAGVEGSGQINGVQRVTPSLQPHKGVFNVANLDGLDILLTEMGKRNMKAILFLSNNWEWSGGFLQYLNWNDLLPDSILRRKLSWNEMRDYVSKFYTCTSCIEDYKKQVNLVINRINSVSGKKYTDDPAIMAWELANEPRPMRPSAINSYKKWISNSAAFIKKLDPNHLVTLGTEGYMGTENLQLYKDIHGDKNVDYLTIHIWPKNWSWFRGKNIAGGMDSVISKTINYLHQHETIARELNKPLVIEEFGLPRDYHSYDIDSPTTYRDIYYSKILNEWLKNKRTNGLLAGVNFWAYGGIAKPIKGQIMWKEGDDYMGDPPMEEQGLNSVFDSDVSTWQLIESFTKNIKD